jgi:hypothetical protein
VPDPQRAPEAQQSAMYISAPCITLQFVVFSAMPTGGNAGWTCSARLSVLHVGVGDMPWREVERLARSIAPCR